MMKPFEMILSYEAQEIPQEAALEMFAILVATGAIWKLPTDYLDMASVLIKGGFLKDHRSIN